MANGQPTAPLRIRVGKDGRMLLLGCPATGLLGRIALGRHTCAKWHVAVKTDGFQHPSCIDFRLTDGRAFTQFARTDTTRYSRCYVVGGAPGEFDVLLRWVRNHSPYPKIKDMEVWCFGLYLGSDEYPKASSDYKTVAHVAIAEDGAVTVNGRNAGVWPEFASSTASPSTTGI